MPNMYEYFISKGLELVAPHGYFSFVVPDRFGHNDQFINLRKRVLASFQLQAVFYRAPFPKVTADTVIFLVAAQPASNHHAVRIGEFGEGGNLTPLTKLLDDPKARFGDVGGSPTSRIVEKILCSRVSDLLKRLFGRLLELVQNRQAFQRQDYQINKERF